MSFPWTGLTPPGLDLASDRLDSRLAANATSVSAGMAALGLSVPLANGSKYAFAAVIMMNSGSGTDGARFDFDASTATVSDFRYWWLEFTALGGGFVTALATDFPGLDSGDNTFLIIGSVEPSSDGTLAMRFSQAAHTTETLTVYRGSWLMAWPI